MAPGPEIGDPDYATFLVLIEYEFHLFGFLVASVPISSVNDRALTYLRYFTAAEGPFWRHIRGKGLAYGSDMWINHERGVLYFSLDQAPGVTEAYDVAKVLTFV